MFHVEQKGIFGKSWLVGNTPKMSIWFCGTICEITITACQERSCKIRFIVAYSWRRADSIAYWEGASIKNEELFGKMG
jgi:hypothetical protein